MEDQQKSNDILISTSINDSEKISNFETQELIEQITDEKEKKELIIKKKVFLITMTLVFLGTLITIIIAFAERKKYFDPEIYNFSCFSDSGSTSSKIHIYTWPKKNKNFYPDLKELSIFTISPAISKLETDSEIEKNINLILNSCQKQINYFSDKKADFSKIPFFLRATAGMRSLPQEKQNKIIEKIRETVKKSKFMYNDESAKVITGEDEGLFGWISINFIQNTIQENHKNNKINSTYGTMDLGGSSMEITFETNETERSRKVKFHNLEYKIYSVVFNHYGQWDMYNKLLNYLIEKKNNGIKIDNPCFLKEYSEKYNYSNTEYTFIGTGNYEECSIVMKELVTKGVCPYEKCFMDGIYRPDMEESQKYIAFSGFAYAAGFFGFNQIDYYSAKDFVEPTKKFCGLKWNEALIIYKDSSAKDYLKLYCYVGNYLYHVFTDGFGFEENTKKIIFTTELKGSNSISWALGAMIYEIIQMLHK